MITSSIITLSSDFIQHIFLIALVGLAFMEYILAFFALKHQRFTDSIKKNMNIIEVTRYMLATRLILIIVLMAAAWFMGEYFFNNSSLAYSLFFRWPLVICILAVFMIFMSKNSAYISRLMFSVFAVFLAIYIISDIVNYFVYIPEIVILIAFERIAAMSAFFFSFLSYFASNRLVRL